MDSKNEARFRQIVTHMLAHGRRVRADLLVLEAATLFMTDASYVFNAMFCDAEFEYRQVTVYFWRGLHRVEYLRGSEDDLLNYCRVHNYHLTETP